MLHSTRFHHWRRHGTRSHSLPERLASMMSDKCEESHSTVMGWLRCAISFSLLRSSLVCLYDQERQRPNTNNSRRMRGNSIGWTLCFIASNTNTFHRSTIHFAVHFSLLSFFILPSLFLLLLPSPLLSSALTSLLYTLFFSFFYS